MQHVNWKKTFLALPGGVTPVCSTATNENTRLSVFLLCGGRWTDLSITSLHFFWNVNGLVAVFRHSWNETNYLTFWIADADVSLCKPTAEGMWNEACEKYIEGICSIQHTHTHTDTAVVSQGCYLWEGKLASHEIAKQIEADGLPIPNIWSGCLNMQMRWMSSCLMR